MQSSEINHSTGYLITSQKRGQILSVLSFLSKQTTMSGVDELFFLFSGLCPYSKEKKKKKKEREKNKKRGEGKRKKES